MPVKTFFGKFLIIIRERKNIVDSITNNTFLDEDIKTVNILRKSSMKNNLYPNIDILKSIIPKKKESDSFVRLHSHSVNIKAITENIKENKIEHDLTKDYYYQFKIGLKNIKLYEFTLFFLLFKKRIYEFLMDSIIVNKKSRNENEPPKTKLTLNQVLGIETDDIDILNMEDEHINNGMNDDFLKIHKKKTRLLLNLNDIEKNLVQLNNDLKEIQDKNFEVFDHIKITSLFESNFSSFVIKKKTKSMRSLFEKYDNDLMKKKISLNEKMLQDSNKNEKKLMMFILEYEIAHKNLEKFLSLAFWRNLITISMLLIGKIYLNLSSFQ